MKVAFVHYHLKPGGVTTVIRQQIEAVKHICEVLVIAGEAAEDPLPVKTMIIPEIGYDRPGKTDPAPEKTARKIVDALSKHWPSGCDIMHVHNPLLKKNSHLIKILSCLQDHNVRLLLQIHDFAEDGRPGAFYVNDPYPADCHFCVINSRDYHALLESGLKPSGLHLLMNMVSPFDLSPEQKIDKEFVLYPVRAIRRKNIGEAMLQSLFFPKGRFLAVTLPPNSKQDWIHYNKWKQFASDNKLPILFEASGIYNFTDLVQSAKSMITTSISEGFGFSYLEPWTAGQLINGRMLPSVIDDFKREGMQLDHMYETLLTPLKWIDFERFSAQWNACIQSNASLYNIQVPKNLIDKVMEQILKKQTVDFGMLNEFFQQQVILKILSHRRFRSRFLLLNPFLEKQTDASEHQEKIRHNRRIVEFHFDCSHYRDRLMQTYQKVIQTTVNHSIDKQKLAAGFLKPAIFSLLKWSHSHV